MTAIYKWQGAIEKDTEDLVIAKTSSEKYDALEAVRVCVPFCIVSHRGGAGWGEARGSLSSIIIPVGVCVVAVLAIEAPLRYSSDHCSADRRRQRRIRGVASRVLVTTNGRGSRRQRRANALLLLLLLLVRYKWC